MPILILKDINTKTFNLIGTAIRGRNILTGSQADLEWVNFLAILRCILDMGELEMFGVINTNAINILSLLKSRFRNKFGMRRLFLSC